MGGGRAMLLCAFVALAALRLPEGAQGALPARGANLPGFPPVPHPGPCQPPAPGAPARVGLKGYRRFFANDSLIGTPVRCTREDKICFRYNLLFHPATGRCQPIGEGDPEGCDLRIDMTELLKGTGRAIGICKEFEDPCPGYRMAHDNHCYRKEVVRDVICGCKAQPARHIAGNVECRSTTPRPINVQQPKQDGQCRIPDLRFPDTERSAFYYKNPLASVRDSGANQFGFDSVKKFRFECRPEQARCFDRWDVWVSGHNGCYRLLQKGPCQTDHVVALDGKAAFQGRAEAVCVHARDGCPRGQIRMAFDGQCQEERELRIAAPGTVSQNQFGKYVMMPPKFWMYIMPIKSVASKCKLNIYVELNKIVITASGEPQVAFPKPPCGGNNRGHCDLYAVEAQPPMPD